MFLFILLQIFSIDSNYIAVPPEYKINYTIDEPMPISGPNTEYPWCNHVKCPNCGESCIMYNGELYNYDHLIGLFDSRTTKHVCVTVPVGDIPIYFIIGILLITIVVTTINKIKQDGNK